MSLTRISRFTVSDENIQCAIHPEPMSMPPDMLPTVEPEVISLSLGNIEDDWQNIIGGSIPEKEDLRFIRSSKRITLSRSETMFIQIKGVMINQFEDATQECHCDACKKWENYHGQPSNLPTQEPLRQCTIDPQCVQSSFAIELSEDAKAMERVYSSFQRKMETSRFINRSGNLENDEVKRPAKRYVG